MHDFHLGIFLVLGGMTAAFAEDPPVPTRLPRDNLLLYRAASGQPTPAERPADWAARRVEILAGFQRVAGAIPGPERRVDPSVEILEEVDAGSYVRRLITYATEPNCRTPAYLLIPKRLLETSGLTAPAVLCLHGTDNVVGHGTVVGLGSRPNRGTARELAERGYVTFAPSYPLLANYQPDLRALGWESGTLKAVWDNLRGLDLLATLPYVDGQQFGVIGHSLGGHNAVYTALFDERLAVVVSSCGLDSFLDYYGGDERNWVLEKGWCQTRYMPRLAEYRGRLSEIPFDFHELIGALAPRRVLIIAPLQDANFQAASVDRIAAAARPVYRLLGAETNLEVLHPDCPHDFPPEMREAAYRVIDHVLRPQGAR
jgi:dienelactone hydrolase